MLSVILMLDGLPVWIKTGIATLTEFLVLIHVGGFGIIQLM